jgi:hypothetical protein
MSVATHIVKIKGTFDEKIWDERKLEEYVDFKIENEINETFNTDLDLYDIVGNHIEIWVLIFGYPSEVDDYAIDKWIRDHITEDGLKVDSFEFKKLVDLTEKYWRYEPFITIPIRYKCMKMKKTMGKLKEIEKGE